MSRRPRRPALCLRPSRRPACPTKRTAHCRLSVTPGRGGAAVDALCAWLRREHTWVQRALAAHGALRFRGFEVAGAEDFEAVCRAIEPELKNDYMGTSPRDAVTDYVFNASELPDSIRSRSTAR